jgi:pyruvate dehydrogenase E1 component beta subunit
MPWSKISIEKYEGGFDHSKGTEGGRKITYIEAVREAFDQALSTDKRVFLMGQGVDDHTAMFGATLDLHKKYGSDRVFDVPLSENALTGVSVGAALTGFRPVYLHNRPDFLLVAMDQIINHAAKWSYMSGGNGKVPLVIWAPIGRGWGTAAQHSQALQGLFMHAPGLKLVMPSTPYDAKGLIISSIMDDNPVIIIEHRWQFKHTGYVPPEPYSIPLGRAAVRRQGKEITIVGASYMIIEAMRAATELEKQGIDAEVIDLRTIKPLDEDIILKSIKKTGKLLIVDTGWKTGGISAEIAALAAEKGFGYLKKPISRVASPDVPTPASHVLENVFYPGAQQIIEKAKEMVR